jgi:hypothetical protein
MTDLARIACVDDVALDQGVVPADDLNAVIVGLVVGRVNNALDAPEERELPDDVPEDVDIRVDAELLSSEDIESVCHVLHDAASERDIVTPDAIDERRGRIRAEEAILDCQVHTVGVSCKNEGGVTGTWRSAATNLTVSEGYVRSTNVEVATRAVLVLNQGARSGDREGSAVGGERTLRTGNKPGVSSLKRLVGTEDEILPRTAIRPTTPLDERAPRRPHL